MEVSVIIPVYNAEAFVAKAVNSALDQPETQEILLIEDGSTDHSLRVCQDLSKNHEKIILLTHADGKNHGAGATRNLGLKKAKYDCIAFLDADDYYLPDRFKKERTLLKEKKVDGVYGATGFHIYSKEAEQKYNNSFFNTKKLTTVNTIIPPKELFYALMGHPKRKGQRGHFTLDALTIKKSTLKETGLFNPNLNVHQDTEWIMRLALTSNIYSGELSKPIVMRGVHGNNRIVGIKNLNKTRTLQYAAFLNWVETHNIKQKDVNLIKNKKAIYEYRLTEKKVDFKKRWRFIVRHPGILRVPKQTMALVFYKGNQKELDVPFSIRVLWFGVRKWSDFKKDIYALLH